jgi:hypothetical protein
MFSLNMQDAKNERDDQQGQGNLFPPAFLGKKLLHYQKKEAEDNADICPMEHRSVSHH